MKFNLLIIVSILAVISITSNADKQENGFCSESEKPQLVQQVGSNGIMYKQAVPKKSACN